MNDMDLKQLKEVIREVVGESHQGVSKSVSDNVHAIKEEMVSLRTSMDNLVEQKKIQNGKVFKNQENIQNLMQWKYWIMGGLAVIIFIVPYFSYTNNQQFTEIKDSVKALEVEIHNK